MINGRAERIADECTTVASRYWGHWHSRGGCIHEGLEPEPGGYIIGRQLSGSCLRPPPLETVVRQLLPRVAGAAPVQHIRWRSRGGCVHEGPEPEPGGYTKRRQLSGSCLRPPPLETVVRQLLPHVADAAPVGAAAAIRNNRASGYAVAVAVVAGTNTATSPPGLVSFGRGAKGYFRFGRLPRRCI